MPYIQLRNYIYMLWSSVCCRCFKQIYSLSALKVEMQTHMENKNDSDFSLKYLKREPSNLQIKPNIM